MTISTVRKTFKLDDEITLDDGTIISIRKKMKETSEGLQNKSGYQLTIIRDGEIGKIRVTKPTVTMEEKDGNR